MPDHATFYFCDPQPLTAAELRPLVGDAEVIEQRSGFLRRRTTLAVRWPGVLMTFNSMPSAEMPEHLDGFAGFVRAQCPGDVRPLLQRVRAVQQVIGSTIEPGEPDGPGDERVERLVRALAARRRALVFRPRGCFDEHGEPFLAPRAPAPRAPAPRAPAPMGEPSVLGALPEEPTSAQPPAPERVHQRARALALVVLRGTGEVFDRRPDSERERHLASLRAEVARLGVSGELEPEEAEWLVAPAGGMSREAANRATWRSEGLIVLGWALGILAQLPPHDEMADIEAVCTGLGVFAPAAPAVAPTLRSPEELDVMSRHLLGLHWRLRDFRVRPRRMDFAAFSRRCWFGSFDLLGAPLVHDDLAVGGAGIVDADPARVAMAEGIAEERHRAILWLCGDDPVYSAIVTST